MTERGDLSEELDLLAAEYAFGLADEADCARAAELEAADDDFARRVAQWRDHGAKWLEEIEGEPVGDHVWKGLAPLFDEAPVAPIDAARSQRLSQNASEWASQARTWRARSYVALAASLVLAVLLGTVLALDEGNRIDGGVQSSEAQPMADAGARAQPRFENLAVAQISSSEGAPLISAVYDQDQGALRLRVAEFDAVNKAPELWVLDTSGTPISLGLAESSELTVELSDELRSLLVEGAIIAVTLENRETAPHDAPTGPILGTGELVIL